MTGKLTWVVPEGVSGERADKALAAAFPEFSRVALQRAFEAGRVFRANRTITKREPVSAGEVLVFSPLPSRPSELRPAAIPLDVLYEDSDLLVINKASGMVVHPGAGTGEDTLVHALLAHCEGQLSGVGGVERPGIVHRLDKETSGAIVVARNDTAHRELSRQFGAREVEKQYLALVSGAPELLSGVVSEPIGRHPVHRHRMAVPVSGGGREARTEWERVETFGSIGALLRCRIQTGRTHQIRVHLASKRHPLLGDAVYGRSADPRLDPPPSRVMLHAEKLAFSHPATGRRIEIGAPVPADFHELIERLRRCDENNFSPVRTSG